MHLALATTCMLIPLGEVVTRTGTFTAPKSVECVSLSIGEAGVLELRHLLAARSKARSIPIRAGYDVTAISWSRPNELVFSTSAMYGAQAGVYVYNVRTRKVRSLVLPPAPTEPPREFRRPV